MPKTKLTVPQALQENKPFLAWVGAQDLAVEKARTIPQLVAGTASTVQAELPKVGQQVSAQLVAKVTEVKSDVEARRAAARATVRSTVGSTVGTARGTVTTARGDARARVRTRVAELADSIAEAYQSLAARGDRVVSAYATVGEETAEPQAA